MWRRRSRRSFHEKNINQVKTSVVTNAREEYWGAGAGAGAGKAGFRGGAEVRRAWLKVKF